MWKIIDTGKRSAKQNMAIDAKLLEELSPNGPPILHFYDWEGECATYGHFLKLAPLLNLDKAQARNLHVAKRPTGGGITFHICDFAFSALVPAGSACYRTNTLENYSYINSIVKKAVKIFIQPTQSLSLLPESPPPLDEHCNHFCMARPTKYDVVLNGKKIAGAAQRKQRQGYLHQGSIAIAPLKENFLDDLLLPGTKVKEAIFQTTGYILDADWSPSDLREVRIAIKHQLYKEFSQ